MTSKKTEEEPKNTDEPAPEPPPPLRADRRYKGEG